ncbi:MAG: hypothetical protein EB007_07555 [Betaproteobacteria bacterium]|nr:hypothetical protein [Betaproteobacteria bacterium]
MHTALPARNADLKRGFTLRWYVGPGPLARAPDSQGNAVAGQPPGVVQFDVEQHTGARKLRFWSHQAEL